MEEKNILTAKEVATMLEISVPSAYRIIKQLNKELQAKGKIILPGKVSKKFFYEKIYF